MSAPAGRWLLQMEGEGYAGWSAGCDEGDMPHISGDGGMFQHAGWGQPGMHKVWWLAPPCWRLHLPLLVPLRVSAAGCWHAMGS